MSIIHWHRPWKVADGRDDPHSLRISAYDWGDVESIEALLVSKNRNEGHEIIQRGGDCTGPEGRPRALFFDIVVTLDGHEPMRWEHGVRESDEPWLKPIPARSSPTTPSQEESA